MRSLLYVAALASAMAACHEPEQQPPVPPKPTNPTNGRPQVEVALERTGEVLDASIVSEVSVSLDVGVFQLEATPMRAAP